MPKATKEQKEKCRIITPEFRVSYPHLFKPQSPRPEDKLKFSITMLFPKDTEMMGSSYDGKPRTIKGVIKRAKTLEFGDKESWPTNILSPVNDGDAPEYADKEGYKGHWIIKATSSEDQRPAVVDQKMKPVTDPAIIFPGCYARAYIYAYVWFYPDRNKPMKKGVGFILDHVQKLRDGKPFSSKKPVEQVFSPVASDDDDEETESDDDEVGDFN